MRTFFALALAVLAWPAPAPAATLGPSNPPPTVLLTWDASPSPGVTNCTVYWGGASRSYTNSLSVGPVLTAKVSPLPFGATVFFAVTATDGMGLESAFSNEVSVTTPAPPDPPGLHSVVTLTAQSADWLWAPWSDFIAWQVTGPAQAAQFWRLVIDR